MSKNEQAQLILEQIESAEDEELYRRLRDRLFGLGAQIIPLLRKELLHDHHLRRMAAATNLGRLNDSDSLLYLLPLLNDPQSEVREMVLFALGILGNPDVHEHVLNAYADFDPDVRYRAIVALADLCYPKLESVLIQALDDEYYGVREQALSQLRALASPLAISGVLRALLEREKEMQKMAEETLDLIVPKLTRSHYQTILDDLSPRERRLILNYLEIRKLNEVYPVLCQRLQLIPKKAAKEEKRALDKYGRLLNSDEERPFLKRAFFRQDIVNMLTSHFKNQHKKESILLVGDVGTGKTAVVHEFIHQLLEEESNWQILETNTAELISGTRYLGDWETKLKEMAEAISKEEKVLLYMTNPNDLLGAGAHSKSDENFADFFKPYLQRGQIRILAECSEEELKNGLTRDPSFLRHFKQIKLDAMDDAKTLAILENVVANLSVEVEGEKRDVVAEPSCLEMVVDFSKSFYTRSEAPGRACDFLDALVDYALRHQSYERPDDPLVLQDELIPPCLSELSGIQLDLLDDSIPLNLSQTLTWFNDRLIDQTQASQTITDRLALIKTGLTNPARPLGVFFLVGPTGVGKTHFSQLVAERIFGDKDRMIRFDLSEYRGRYAVEKLIGSPHEKDREGLLTEAVRNQPFSVLLFDEFEKADPEIYNLFLQIMDEGRLSDARGKTTDFRQTLIFFTSNLGASGTSMGSLGFNSQNDTTPIAASSTTISKSLDDFFAPEFLNRIDEIVIFNPLTPHAMEALCELEIRSALSRRGIRRRKIEISISESAKRWLEIKGFSKKFGARSLKRVIEKHVLSAIGKLLLTPDPGRLTSPTKTTIQVDVKHDQIVASLLPPKLRSPDRKKKQGASFP